MALTHIPQSTTQRGLIDFSNWLSIMRAQGIVAPQFYNEIVRRSGMGDTLFAMLELTGKYISVKDEILKVVEEGDLVNVVTTGATIATNSAGQDISVTIANYDTQTGEDPIAVGDGIVIPDAYQGTQRDEIYVVTSISNHVATCKPLNSQARIATAVPSNTILKIHSYYTARRTGMPKGVKQKLFLREYRTQIIKTSLVEEGGIGAIEVIPVANGKFITIKNQAFAELVHNKKIDDTILLSQENTNNVTVTTKDGGSNLVLSTKGLWNWAKDAGDAYYYGSTFGINEVGDLKDYLRANNITSQEVLLVCGAGLNKMIEDSGLQFIQDYSGGTSLLSVNKLGIDIKYVHRNGVLLGIKEIQSFNNATGLGGDAYDFVNRGIVIPIEDVGININSEKKTLPNLLVGYLNNNGVDRSRVIRVIDGVTGRESVSMHEYDESALYILTEMMVIVLAPNKLITIEKTK